jgi:hypothetical protein
VLAIVLYSYFSGSSSPTTIIQQQPSSWKARKNILDFNQHFYNNSLSYLYYIPVLGY